MSILSRLVRRPQLSAPVQLSTPWQRAVHVLCGHPAWDFTVDAAGRTWQMTTFQRSADWSDARTQVMQVTTQDDVGRTVHLDLDADNTHGSCQPRMYVSLSTMGVRLFGCSMGETSSMADTVSAALERGGIYPRDIEAALGALSDQILQLVQQPDHAEQAEETPMIAPALLTS